MENIHIEYLPGGINGNSAGTGIEESHEQYRLLLDCMSEGFVLHEIIYDEHGQPCDLRILDVNSAFERLTGFKKEEVLGRTYNEVVSKKDRYSIDLCRAVLDSNGPIHMASYSNFFGRHFEATAYSPAPRQLAVLFKDITPKIKMEMDLKTSEAKSKAILESVPDLIFQISSDGKFLDYRAPAGFEVYAPPEAFLGKGIDEILPRDLADLAFRHMKITKETSAVQSFEYSLETGGQTREYEARVATGEDGNFIFFVRDISERKRMQQALLESEMRLRAAVDSIPNFFMIYDEELRFRYVNRTFVERIGLSEEQVTGRTNEELFPPEVTEKYMGHLKKALQTKRMQRSEYSHDTPPGRLIFHTIYVPILNDKGRVSQILGISHDLTKIREAESLLERTLEENEKQNRLLKTVIQEMKGNYDEIERLLFAISHDLMTPLITIQGFLELLKKDVEKCNRIRIEIDLGLIGDAVSRMQTLLGRALELSSLGTLSSSTERLPFQEIIDAAREHFKRINSASHLKITEDENFPAVCFNRTRMQDILVSMIEGCIRYSGAGYSSRVNIGWKEQDEGPIIYARCLGKGEMKDLSQAFDLLSGGEVADNCTSIGLALSKRIIELHGGRMWLESEPEGGCSILFALPREVKA
ncbi:MAG TPA: PAS domain S-box protein [Methanothrix sp.]|nr:PAS domain S-box protein [Methanothrix sp.]HPT18869.1 PAS domain S-box protein [Methanothrix sp.]